MPRKLSKADKREAISVIEDQFMQGKLAPIAARAAGVSVRTLFDLQRDDDDTAQRFARAREIGADALIQEAQDILDKADKDKPQKAREQAHHRRWLASKLRPTYNDKAAVSASSKGDGGVTVEIVQGLGD
ncbi:hypothetical protein [Salinisphaera sp.]|uniref:terminase small subunit-like protein n=1 Tax=Salinisphaera sp. TaxID=1914330 RepID=UPI000C662CE2|nr:hypothetical protein [Salinisphaera sp.]MAS09905.1 hypothetical protein [Salinisphaera sp.]MAS09960.1 hypothetical protein [Salinisphaera sp.]|tara:strand:+ start:22313 stop:22702 length:390 start_codon:yes stop_codon:yes gene_type:complete